MSPEPVSPVVPETPPVDAPPEPPETAPPAPARPAPPDDSRSVEARLSGMEIAVTNLVETLTGLISAGSDNEPEHKPVKKPWTYWGTKVRDET